MRSSDVQRRSFLVVGLGNPGEEYELTRHNVGRLAAKHCIDRKGLTSEMFRCAELYIEARGTTEIIWLLQNININMSGSIVKDCAKIYQVTAHDICVLHDDVNISFASFRVRFGRGSGGHKGLESVITTLGTREFVSICIGIGKPVGMRMYDYVVTRFSDAELKKLAGCFERVGRALECWASEGLGKCQQIYNTSDSVSQ